MIATNVHFAQVPESLSAVSDARIDLFLDRHIVEA